MKRRYFLQSAASVAGIASVPGLAVAQTRAKPGAKMRFGLVTYLWGQDWDLPTLIANCEKSQILGVELRTQHKHGVEPGLSAGERKEVRKRFADSPVICLGPGSNENFDSPDPDKLKRSVEATKAFLKLSHEIGASGVKVKPNSFHKDVPKEKTIAQIGKSLHELGQFAADLGQEVRLEVHGQCSPLPYIKQIMEAADHPQAVVCWNSNKQDLDGEGVEHNFDLVKKWFGKTVHVRELNIGDYPYKKLIGMFVAADYDGWILLEARTRPEDRIVALKQQREVFANMVRQAQASL